jgi:hypothetical protein
MLAATLLALAASVAADPQPSQPPTAPAKVEAFVKHCETSRRGAIMTLEHTLRGLQAREAKSPEVAKQIASVEADLRVLRANKEPLVPPLGFPPEVGAIGRLPRLTCHVEQVVSANEMIVRCNFPIKVMTVRHYQARGETVTQGINFLVRGVSTSEAHEGADLPMLQVLEITGKQTYKTVEGKLNSVWVLAEFDMKAAEPYFRQLAAGPR